MNTKGLALVTVMGFILILSLLMVPLALGITQLTSSTNVVASKIGMAEARNSAVELVRYYIAKSATACQEDIAFPSEDLAQGSLKPAISCKYSITAWQNGKAVAIPGVSLKPWIKVPSVAVLTPVVIEDPEGDDYGPGYYTYPTDPVFKDGDFDLLKFELGLYEGSYTATYTVGNLDNAWGSDNGLSKATYFLFIDNKADEGTTQGIEGLNISFAENFKWDVAMQIEGWESKVYKVSSGEINSVNAADLGVEIKGTEGAPGQVVVDIPKDVVGELTAESKIMVMVAGQDGFGTNRIRQVTPEAQQWRFGGGNEEGTAPAVIDMIVPEGMKQEEILDYKTDVYRYWDFYVTYTPTPTNAAEESICFTGSAVEYISPPTVEFIPTPTVVYITHVEDKHVEDEPHCPR